MQNDIVFQGKQHELNSYGLISFQINKLVNAAFKQNASTAKYSLYKRIESNST